VLQALETRFEVHVLLVPIGSRAHLRELPPRFAHLRPRFRIAEDSGRTLAPKFHPDGSVAADAGDAAVDGFVEEALRDWRHVDFDVVHIYRLPLAPFARAFDAASSRRFLDVDDIESITSARLADLYALNGRASAAENSRRYAEVHRLREETGLRPFDGVFTCSRTDAGVLQRMYGCATFVLPNTVAMPPRARSEGPPDALTILLVGSMDYHPNEDAALQLVNGVLPGIRRLCPAPVRVLIVGNSPRASVLALASQPDVTVTGAVDSVTPYYRRAAVVVVPIRAGGGTRIKILEAAAHRVPVVSTPMGAEGLEVIDGQELLLAATPEEMAVQCVRLWTDRPLRTRLVRNAHAWVAREHTAQALDRALADAYGPFGVGGRGRRGRLSDRSTAATIGRRRIRRDGRRTG
jgi:glycosyltransferase involved in cell wall biosynthesis